MAELPMFPLGTALVPSAVLPLHVFEERYRALVRTCLAGDGDFGVVLIERGSEVGGGEVRSSVGTRARIVASKELPDGRFAVAAQGVERLRVQRWLPDDPHPWADVEPWPDEPEPDEPGPDAPSRAMSRALSRVPLLAALSTAVALQAGKIGAPGGAEGDDAIAQLALDPGLASYQAAVRAGMGPFDLHRLLCCPTAGERLDLTASLLSERAEVLRGLARPQDPDGPPPPGS
jgi:hypothetical protein